MMISQRCRNTSLTSQFKKLELSLRSGVICYRIFLGTSRGNMRRKDRKAYFVPTAMMEWLCPTALTVQLGLDLTDISHMVEFFRKMLDKRAKMVAEDALQRTASYNSGLGDSISV